ncbi:MAG: hypothetical protein M1832_001018 [Thelocarpon impressellum]|nr:MAG: hypothetical protein M1832_001018 [Thelocarpon impressellum]
MPVRIQLDKPHAHFTSLDTITGRVILNLTTNETVSSVVVKLEGESRTRLSGPKAPPATSVSRPGELGGRNDRTELEVHKLLYNVSEVFPSAEMKQQTASNAGYTMRAGQYEYPFQFRLPINNNCALSNSLYSNLNFYGARVELARDTEKHVKKTLPPSLTGFPGEADIRYYVKVTVHRPQFYKENRRAFSNFKFLPIEPPRPPDSKQETYARRQHQFAPGPPVVPRRKSVFSGTSRNSSPLSPTGPSEPPRFRVDARLPSPAIITCNEALPLRILVQKQSPCQEQAILQSLQIELIAYTHIRAHDLNRVESGSWVIMSYSNMAVRLGEPAAQEGSEFRIDDALWRNIPLPNTVAPTFETCNMRRSYELEVRVGLANGLAGSVRPELIILPLRLPVKVYSGIAPPRALLDAIAAQKETPPSLDALPPRPTTQTPTSPTQAPSYTPAAGADDAPPSYEDAMAEDIGPVDGRRRDYADMPGGGRTGTGLDTGVGDGKRDFSGGPRGRVDSA